MVVIYVIMNKLLHPIHFIIREHIGVDRAILNVIIARLWSLIAGPVSILLITKRLSLVEQGYYYTFISMLSLTLLLELGLYFVILQFASHQMTALYWEGGILVGDPVAKARLAAVLRKAILWYSSVAGLILLVIVPGGWFFFSRNSTDAGIDVEWRLPWVLLVTASAISILMSPITSIIEGCGLVAIVTRVRMLQGMAMGISLWIGLICGLKLFAASMAGVAAATVTIFWLVFKMRRFVVDLIHFRSNAVQLSWKQEVLPLQWRTAVTAISAYFTFQLFNPVIFAYKGPVEAGKVGMTLNLISVVGAVSLSWMSTKAAPFGKLVASRQWEKLDTIFGKTLRQSIAAYILGCLMLQLVVAVLRHYGSPICDRMLGFLPMAVFMLAQGFNQTVSCFRTYVNAHMADPYYGLSLLNGVIVASILLCLASRFSILNISIAYCIVMIFPSYFIARKILMKYRRIWHAL